MSIQELSRDAPPLVDQDEQPQRAVHTKGATMTRIDVFTAGGTISSTPNPAGGASPTLSGQALLAGVITADLDVRVRERDPLPSNWMTVQDALDLARAVDRAAADGADGALIVQGTDTLEETGFVVELARRSTIPVALTGAMRTPATAGADGAANIGGALRYLAVAEGNTTAVVMNDEVHPARHVRKTDAVLTSAFQSAPFGPWGVVVESHYLPYRSSESLERRLLSSVHSEPSPVLLVTATLGDDLSWVPVVSDRFAGVVVNAMGAAHVSRDAAHTLRDIAARIPVVVTTRTGGAALPSDTYTYDGSERFFRDNGALVSGGLDALRARLLLSLVVTDDLDETKRRYREIERQLVPGLASHH